VGTKEPPPVPTRGGFGHPLGPMATPRTHWGVVSVGGGFGHSLGFTPLFLIFFFFKTNIFFLNFFLKNIKFN
jgi:hypothetical protein